jgi:WD40 repeat protein
LATGGDDRTVRLWNVATGAPAAPPAVYQDAVLGIKFSPDGQRLAIGTGGGKIHVRTVGNAQPQMTFAHGDGVHSISFSPDGRTLASVSAEDSTVRLWDLVSGQERVILRGHGRSLFTVAFSPDGKLLASGGDDPTIRLWRTGDEGTK